MAFNTKKFYGVDGMLLEKDDSTYYPRIVNDKKRHELSLNMFKIEEQERANFGGKLPKITERQLLENIHNVYFDIYNDSLQKNYFWNCRRREVMENEMKDLGKGKEVKGEKIYSDSDDCESCTDYVTTSEVTEERRNLLVLFQKWT